MGFDGIYPLENIDYLGNFHHDRTRFDRALEIKGWFIGKSSPFMAELFRLGHYGNLPRYDASQQIKTVRCLSIFFDNVNGFGWIWFKGKKYRKPLYS